MKTVSLKEYEQARRLLMDRISVLESELALVRATNERLSRELEANQHSVYSLGKSLRRVSSELHESKLAVSDQTEPQLKLKDFLKLVPEPVQVVVNDRGERFIRSYLSNACHTEEDMERNVYEISSTVTFGFDGAKIRVSAW